MTEYFDQAALPGDSKVSCFDTVVLKPAAMGRYAVHRAVEGLAAGQEGHALFIDDGDRFVVRTRGPIDGTSMPVVAPPAGTLAMFEVHALACQKVRGSRRWFAKNDWRARHDWLQRKAANSGGLEVLTVNASSEFLKIEKGTGINLDTTRFTGVLRVLDQQRFALALRDGLSSGGRCFGLNMLRII